MHEELRRMCGLTPCSSYPPWGNEDKETNMNVVIAFGFEAVVEGNG
jgi:hypothetical protein